LPKIRDLSKLDLNERCYIRINEHDARYCRFVAVFDRNRFDGRVTYVLASLG